METSLMLHLKPDSGDISDAQTGGPFGTEDRYKLLDAQFARPVYFVDEFSEVSENGPSASLSWERLKRARSSWMALPGRLSILSMNL
jgi:hypothetical protein